MIICTNNLKRYKITTPVHCSKITFLFSAKTCPVVEQIIQFSSSQLLWTGRRTWIYTLINTYIYIHYFPIHIQINIRSEVEIRETHELGSDVPCLLLLSKGYLLVSTGLKCYLPTYKNCLNIKISKVLCQYAF